MRTFFFDHPKKQKGKILILANEIYPETCVGGLGRFVAGVASGFFKKGWEVKVFVPDKSKQVYLPLISSEHKIQSQKLALGALNWCGRNNWQPSWAWFQDWEGIHQMEVWEKKAKLLWTFHSPVSLNANYSYGYGYFENESEDKPIDWGDDFFDFAGLLKQGFERADVLTTVSPTYAKKLANFGFSEKEKIWGVINGLDKNEWDPQKNKNLGFRLAGNWQEFKKINKKVLQAYFNLPQKKWPVFAFVSRLVPQKGLDLLLKTLPEFLGKNDVQLVVVGEGLKRYHDFFEGLKQDFPLKVGLCLKSNFVLPHQVFAGADFLLLPSFSEPFGIVVAEARSYGAVPIVRAVDGLADQVKDEVNGLAFKVSQAESLITKLYQAKKLCNCPFAWEKMRGSGASFVKDWQEVAGEYESILPRFDQKRSTACRGFTQKKLSG